MAYANKAIKPKKPGAGPVKPRQGSFDAARKEVFLATLAEGWSPGRAAKVAKTSRTTAYAHRYSDPDFARRWDEALEAGTDELEDVATKRATEKSDLLMMFTLKARRPDKFRDNQRIEHTGPNGGPVQIATINFDGARLALDDREAYRRALAERISGPAGYLPGSSGT